MALSDKLSRLRARMTGDTGPTGPGVVSEPSESDVGDDPRLVSSRAAGGEHEELSGDRGSTTGTGDTDVHVGQVVGDDLGYAGETGAERRRAASPEGPAATS